MVVGSQMQKKEFILKKELVSKDILLRVCFSFIEKHYIYLDSNELEWLISISPKAGVVILLDELEGEFRNSLINEEFRDSLLKHTKVVKELIVSKALYGAKETNTPKLINKEEALNNFKKKFVLKDEDLDNYINDPLGISLPWEQRNKKTESTNL